MGNLHLVTGYAGQEHVTATDHGAFNAALIGTGQFVLDKGNVFEAQVISNNQIRILDGELMMQGRFVRLNPDTYVDLTIENGAQGVKRNDLIVARYAKNTSTGVEAVDLVVIKGNAVESNPVDPAFTEGDITNGEALLNEFPLWRIPLDGLNVGEPERLFVPFIDSMRTLPVIRQQVLDIHAEVDAQLAKQDADIQEKISKIESYLKEEVLTDATKALYGLDSSAVPDAAFVAAFNNFVKCMQYVKKCASAESGNGLKLTSSDTKTLSLTDTVTFNFANTLADGEEIVFINGFDCTEKVKESSISTEATYNTKVYLIINGTEHMFLSEQFTQQGGSLLESLRKLKPCNINVFAVAGTAIKKGDSVAIKIAHEKVAGSGYRTVTLSDVTLDVRVL